MNLGDLGKLLRVGTKKNMPTILSAAAGVGTLGTAYLAAKAGYQTAKQNELWPSDSEHDRKELIKIRIKRNWKLYIPTGFSAVGTVGLIVGANRVGTKKTLAAQTAFAVSQQAYSQYRDKVIEEYGEHKDQSIRDKIADERVKQTAPDTGTVIIGSGTVLCCDLHSGRYFNSDMETLRKAQNDINKSLLAHDYATLDDFYYLIGLNPTSYSSQLGWSSDKLLELEFSTALTDDGRPCITFHYDHIEYL